MNIKIIVFVFFTFCSFNIYANDLDSGNRYFQSGAELYNSGDYSQAIDHFNTAEGYFLNVRDRQQKNYMLAYTYLWRGMVYMYSYQYLEAIDDFNNGINIATTINQKDLLTSLYTHLGHTYYARDNYIQALEAYENAEFISRRAKLFEYFSSIYEGIGNVYLAWWNFDESIKYYETALEYATRYSQFENYLSIKIGIGRYYYSKNDFHQALEIYLEAMNLEGSTESYLYGEILNTLGNVYSSMGDYDLAYEYYLNSLEHAKETSNYTNLIRLNIHLAGIESEREEYIKALTRLEFVLPLTEELGREADKAVCFTVMGKIYYYTEEYEKAFDYFLKAIQIKEILRDRATGLNKLDYLASELSIYKLLARCYLNLAHYEDSLEIIELSTAKYLEEQLLGESNSIDSEVSISDIRSLIEDDELIARYAVDENFGDSTYIIDENRVITYVETEEDRIEVTLDIDYNYDGFENLSRGLSLVNPIDNSPLENEIENAEVEDLIAYYRFLLFTGSNSDDLRKLGRFFFDFLFQPIIMEAGDKKSLTIIPDGYLAYLPFETLIMPDGRYVIEEYDISYAQSLAVSEIIRNRVYSDDREDFLGFGGAKYSEFDPTKFPQEFGQINNLEWDDLPGTELEVTQIENLYNASRIFLSEDVTETSIKELSDSGQLTNYKIIHFATHGFVMPDMPQYTALVVTDFEREDGYLTAQEIANLDIQADFVNLSACETGLGKLYGGEGVVGLAQSFLIAGANSLSVSLWKVSDESTSEFMTGFYRLITEEGYNYREAMSEMKRKFINSEDYAHPYYWAPFILYGE